MGGSCSLLSAVLVCGPPAQVAAAADCRGDPVFVARRAAVADAPPVHPAGFDGAALVLPVAGQRAEGGEQAISTGERQ